MTTKSQCFYRHRQSWDYKYRTWPNTSWYVLIFCRSSLFKLTSWGANKCIQMLALLSRTHCSLFITLQWINRRFEKLRNSPLCSIHLLHGEHSNITVLVSKRAFSLSNPSEARILWPAESLSDHIPSSKWLAVTSPSSPRHTVQFKKQSTKIKIIN